MARLFLLGALLVAGAAVALAQMTHPLDLEIDPTMMSVDDTYAVSQSRTVCPVGTRGLTIPKMHVPFWKQFKLTRGLTWAHHNRLMCVPLRLRSSLTPVIAKLRTERMIKRDPLRVPGFIEEVETLEMVEPMTDREIDPLPVTPEEQQAMVAELLASGLTERDIEMLASGEPTSFEAQQFGRRWGGGWGRGGWGRWGGWGGWGRPWGWGGWGGGFGFGFPFWGGFGFGRPWGWGWGW